MRRTLFVALVIGLVLAAAVPAGAREVYNASQAMVQLQGNWGSYDETTGAWTEGWVYATTHRSETWIDYNVYTATPTTCEGDVPGQIVHSIWAGGPGSLSGDRKYAAATASGRLEGWASTWTECWYESIGPENGDGDGEAVSLEVSVQFTATSQMVREKGFSSFKIPGTWNSHDRYSSVYRAGDVAVTANGETVFGGGQFGKVSWSGHYNGK